jgi:hypothetical protein
MQSAFYGCSYLQMSATDIPDLSKVTDMSTMFYGASSFTSDLSERAIGNVTTMSNMLVNTALSTYTYNEILSNRSKKNIEN